MTADSNCVTLPTIIARALRDATESDRFGRLTPVLPHASSSPSLLALSEEQRRLLALFSKAASERLSERGVS